MNFTDPDKDRKRTLRDVANSITAAAVIAGAGVTVMIESDIQHPLFALGVVLAAAALLFLILEVRAVLAPITVPMEVLSNLRPEPEPGLQPALPQRPKRAALKVVVSNR